MRKDLKKKEFKQKKRKEKLKKNLEGKKDLTFREKVAGHYRGRFFMFLIAGVVVGVVIVLNVF